jgi:hypothetical protein
MSSKRKPWVTVLAAAILASSGTYAQTPVPGADPSAKPAKPVKSLKLSLPEMVAKAGTIDAQVRSDMRHVLHLQAKARQEKDVIKLNCINDKMVQLKAQVNIFDSAQAQLNAGIESATADDKQGPFAEVAEAGDAVKSLRAEADICVGEPELFKQETSAEVKRPEIVDDPAGTDPFDPGGPFEAPAYASPFN